MLFLPRIFTGSRPHGWNRQRQQLLCHRLRQVGPREALNDTALIGCQRSFGISSTRNSTKSTWIDAILSCHLHIFIIYELHLYCLCHIGEVNNSNLCSFRGCYHCNKQSIPAQQARPKERFNRDKLIQNLKHSAMFSLPPSLPRGRDDTHICVYKYMYLHICMCTYTCIYIHIHTYTYIYTYTYSIYIYVHTHVHMMIAFISWK